MAPKKPSANLLKNSTSPYLLQHAGNPVHWQEWSTDALEQALAEDKPILVSIGYSSCHWCHVMEKESFEDESVAQLMNQYFVNIKVDREERPDIDHVYMDAIQAMGLRGGWPLNVFLTPDQKPFYGGTYFPKEGWKNLLNSITDAFQNNREKLNKSAEGFTQSLQARETEKYKLSGSEHRISTAEMDRMFELLQAKFDTEDGGIKKSPKFPMPSVWEFLATYAYYRQSEQAKNHLLFTLEKIANGGIYDHVGGGFARYSTDEAWHVPHFEKMLYDNGQLLSLFASGYQMSGNTVLRRTLLETIDWLSREMKDRSGGFYAALDADSEGEEGKFYVWNAEEIDLLTGSHAEMLKAYYDVKASGNWEGKNVLRVVAEEGLLAEKYHLSLDEFWKIIDGFKEEALLRRNKRVKPGLDDKIIAGWNGLALSGLCDAYRALALPEVLQLARQNAHFLQSLIEDGTLKRFPNKRMEGFLEDYAAVIQAFIKYFQVSGDYSFIALARQLVDRADATFYDSEDQLYHFSGSGSEALIAQKKELFDNVIPSSNGLMAWNLIHLGTLTYENQWIEKGQSMLALAHKLIVAEPEYMSQWGLTALVASHPITEVVVVGDQSDRVAQDISNEYLPNKVIAFANQPIEKAPFSGKEAKDNQATVYVCYDQACQQPVHTAEEAVEQIKLPQL